MSWRNAGWTRNWAASPACLVLVTIAFIVTSPAASAKSDQTPQLINDFEGPEALTGWRLSSSRESTTPSVGLAIGPGHHGHGAMLTYRLPCDANTGCDAYDAAIWKPASPLPKRRDPAISLWIRSAPDVEVFLVTRDTSGRTSEFPVVATIEHLKADDWQYVVINLSAKPADSATSTATAGIKGRLVEIGVLVRARGRKTVQGSVGFDEIQVRDSSEVPHISPATHAGQPLTESPDWEPRLGVNIHLLGDNHGLDLAHAAGFGFVRMDMLWTNVERAGRYRFFPYDALLRALDARGMGVLWILDYGHPDHGGSTPRKPEDVAAFGRFAEAVARHFSGRNVQYEIWNEPDSSQFWAPSPNPLEYAALLREALAAIRRGDPSAKVSSGGVSRFDEEFLRQAIDPSIVNDLSAIGIHPYPKTGPETIASELERLRFWVAGQLGERIELWDTEWGYSSADALTGTPSNGHAEPGRKRQAGLAVREMLTVLAVGLPLAVWYDLRDDGPDNANPEHNYGLLDADGNEKPAMEAIRKLMNTVKGRKYGGMIQEMPTGMHALRLEGSTDVILIVWTDQRRGHQTVEYTNQNLISATGLLGEAVPSKTTKTGEARVDIDATTGPIYLAWKASSGGAPDVQSSSPVPQKLQ